MEWTNWLTLGIAVLGATLGVFNAVWLIRKDTVRIRVRSQMLAMTVPHTGHVDYFTMAVEVVNVGHLPVTITEVAFQVGRFARARYPVVQDHLGLVTLPVRLDARSSVSVATHPDFVAVVDAHQATHCSAVTACGVKVVSKIRRKKG